MSDRLGDWLTPEEAARYLRISRRYLQTLSKKGIIPHAWFGLGKAKVRRYSRQMLEEWLRKRCEEPDPDLGALSCPGSEHFAAVPAHDPPSTE